MSTETEQQLHNQLNQLAKERDTIKSEYTNIAFAIRKTIGPVTEDPFKAGLLKLLSDSQARIEASRL